MSHRCSLRSVLISALDLAHVHAAPASQQRPLYSSSLSFLLRILFWAGRQGALAAQKRIRSKKERRESRRVHHVTEMLAPLGLVFGLSFSLSRNGTRRGGAVAAALVLSCAYASCRAVALVCLHCGVVCSHCNGCQTQRASVQRHSFSLPRTKRTGLYLGAWPATPSAGTGGAALTRGFLPADPSSVPGS